MKSSKRAVGPMDVLEQHDHGVGVRHPLEEQSPRGEEVRLVPRRPILQPEQLREPAARRIAVRSDRERCRPRVARSFADAETESSSSTMPARPRTISASAQNATPSPYARHRPRCHHAESARPSKYFSNSHARRDLPIPPTPVTETQVGPMLVGGGVVELLHEPQLAIPADERRLQRRGRRHAPSEPDHSDGAPELHRLRLALQLVAPGVLVGDRGVGRPLGRIADEHASGLCGRLDPGGGVHEVAGDHPLSLGAERHRRFAREDACAGAKLGSSRVLAEGRDGRGELECRPHGALGIILLRDRRPQTAITASPMNFSTVPP